MRFLLGVALLVCMNFANSMEEKVINNHAAPNMEEDVVEISVNKRDWIEVEIEPRGWIITEELVNAFK